VHCKFVAAAPHDDEDNNDDNDDDDDDDDAHTAKRAAPRRSETLKCPTPRKLKIAGVVPLNRQGKPTSPSSGACPYLAGLLQTVQGRCDGRQQCKLSRADIAVKKKQCPGVASVNFRVRCLKKGTFSVGYCLSLLSG